VEPDAFAERHGVSIPCDDLSKEDADYLAVLAAIHDLWKPVTSAEHAELGARFLEDPSSVAAVRFHDRLGVVHTGEAPLLLLDELGEFLRALSPDERQTMLHRLRLFTIVDVAAYGYLNQARVDTYDYLVRLLSDVRQPGDLERLARSETRRRIKRLLEANNRVRVDDDALREACESFEQMAALDHLLVRCRLDYGAYSLEPLFRVLLRRSHDISDTAPAAADKSAPISVFLRCLHDVLAGRTAGNMRIVVSDIIVGTQSVPTYKMSPLSVKTDPANPAFHAWVAAYT
jgi:hypothetical protein